METIRVRFRKMNVEQMVIASGMAVMEGFGLLMLICGILNIKIF